MSMTIRIFDMFMADVIREVGKNASDEDLRRSPVIVSIGDEKFPVKSVGFDLDDWDDPYLLLSSTDKAYVNITDELVEEEKLIPVKKKITDINKKSNEINIGNLIEIFKEFGKAGYDFEVLFSEDGEPYDSEILLKEFEYRDGMLIIHGSNYREENLDQDFDVLYTLISECKKKMEIAYLYDNKFRNRDNTPDMYGTFIDVLKGIDKIKEDLERNGVD